MNLLLLIPARGGSKGLPGKNIALVGGIPMVGRAARLARHAARSLGGQHRVVCSTDDPAIAAAAREWGAEIPFMRPAGLATDEAKSLDVVRHALQALDGEFDGVVLLQPTSPLTVPADVLAAVGLFRETGSPVVSVCRAEHPFEWHQRIDRAGHLTPALPVLDAQRRQELEPSYRANGALYVASPGQVRGAGFWAPGARGLLMPAERSVDVDTAVDLEIARALLAACPVPALEIAGRQVGPGHPCFVIAEAGVNHNGSVEMALRLVDVAVDAGADAVKFQLYRVDEQVTRRAELADYQLAHTEAGSMAEMARGYDLPWEKHREIREHCRRAGVMYLASCFDPLAVDFYVSTLEGPAVKVGSGEITNHPLLEHIARSGKPILLSSGMSTLPEVALAVDAVRAAGCTSLGLFQCVSAYPAPHEGLNLLAMRTLQAAFQVPVGFSDHTEGSVAAVAAVALGACMVEKHFTLDRGLPGPDHAMSLDPRDLRDFVSDIRRAEASLGDGTKRVQDWEVPVQRVARRSLVAGRDIHRGEVLSRENVVLKRPATGISPLDWEKAMGRTATADIAEDTPITWEMLS